MRKLCGHTRHAEQQVAECRAPKQGRACMRLCRGEFVGGPPWQLLQRAPPGRHQSAGQPLRSSIPTAAPQLLPHRLRAPPPPRPSLCLGTAHLGTAVLDVLGGVHQLQHHGTVARPSRQCCAVHRAERARRAADAGPPRVPLGTEEGGAEQAQHAQRGGRPRCGPAAAGQAGQQVGEQRAVVFVVEVVVQDERDVLHGTAAPSVPQNTRRRTSSRQAAGTIRTAARRPGPRRSHKAGAPWLPAPGIPYRTCSFCSQGYWSQYSGSSCPSGVKTRANTSCSTSRCSPSSRYSSRRQRSSLYGTAAADAPATSARPGGDGGAWSVRWGCKAWQAEGAALQG
jgi:hypothetical protein